MLVGMTGNGSSDNPANDKLAIHTSADDAGVRLDVWLVQRIEGCSRRDAQHAIEAGDVRINGRRARKSQMVLAGDVVEAPQRLGKPDILRPNANLAVTVLYEDAALVAVDKPAGIPAHALRPEETDTVANFLVARYPEMSGVGPHPLEAGLLHRLDTETSGALIAARTSAAYAVLRRQFSEHRISKQYLALVEGDLPHDGEISAPVAHAPHNRRKMRVSDPQDSSGRPARTIYRSLERFGSHTLLQVHIETGVMHQIRVHLASIGHPIAGDRLYGASDEKGAPTRHLLHAARIELLHPDSGKAVAIDSPLADDFEDYLGRLRQAARRNRRRSREQAVQPPRT